MRSHKTARLIYQIAVSLSGGVVLAYCGWRIVTDAVSYQWMILAYLTVLSGAFAINIPGVNSKLTASDALVFTNLILFGAAAGAVTAALDGCLASMRFETPSRRRRATPFNTAAMGLSAFVAGEVFFSELGRKPLAQEPGLGVMELVLPLVLSALVYYLLNSALVAGMIALDCAENMLVIWREYFLRISLLSWTGIVAGSLIAYGIRTVAPPALLIVVPVLVILYLVDKVFLRKQQGTTIAADYNPVNQRPVYLRYHYFVVMLGVGFIALLLTDVLKSRVSREWLILALLAACAGLVHVRIPGIKIKITLADTFVFSNTILFGPVVGSITAALDGLSGSLLRRSKDRRAEITLYNMATKALSAYLAGNAFLSILGHEPLFRAERLAFGEIFLPVLVLAISYGMLDALGVATIIALQEETSVVRIWSRYLLWSIADHVACAPGAVFVAAGILAITPAVATAVLLVLACIYITCRSVAQKARTETTA